MDIAFLDESKFAQGNGFALTGYSISPWQVAAQPFLWTQPRPRGRQPAHLGFPGVRHQAGQRLQFMPGTGRPGSAPHGDHGFLTRLTMNFSGAGPSARTLGPLPRARFRHDGSSSALDAIREINLMQIKACLPNLQRSALNRCPDKRQAKSRGKGAFPGAVELDFTIHLRLPGIRFTGNLGNILPIKWPPSQEFNFFGQDLVAASRACLRVLSGC